MTGDDRHRQAAQAADQCREGLVVARHGAQVTVEDSTGRLHECMSRRRLGTVVCGDRVRWRPARNGHCSLEALLPRRSLLARPDARGRLRPVCANVDQLVVVNAPLQASNHDGLRLELLDRYLVAAELMEIQALIVVNKIDLAREAGRRILDRTLAHYAAMGYPVILTSTVSGAGMDTLQGRLAGHTSVLVGESGVGKSSLIQHLLPDLEIRIGEISATSGLGRHTTTTTTLYHLPGGGDLIDSPGVRDFGLWPVTAMALARGFRDFQPWLGQCRFRNCRHEGEAGCALAAAVADGRLPARRLESYRAILADLEARRR